MGVFPHPARIDLAYYGILLVGIAARYLYNSLLSGSGIWPAGAQLWLGMIVSPMVYGVVWNALHGLQQVTVPGAILYFQNGFFWEAVFDALAKPQA